MQYGAVKGVDKKFSRYVMGTMGFRDRKATDEYFERLDKAFEHGITAIDTAQGYGMGVSEMTVGAWMESRGVRDQIVLTTKGCHPNPWRSRVHFYDLCSDLFDSLQKLKTDYIDIYYLHRDDPNTSVAEIMETLNWHYKEGRVKAFGVANWQYERVKEANEYACAHGIPELSIAEEHYSIAEQIADPFRQGSGTVSGPKYAEARKWYAENNIPIASYSTLSGGFLTGRITRELVETNPDAIDNGTRVAYCHEINFKRLDRCEQMAKEKGISIAQVALAYSMSSDMDVYPIIGAANEAEIISSVEALDVKLTKAECDWLDLTTD